MPILNSDKILFLRDDIVIEEHKLRNIVTTHMFRIGFLPSLNGFRYFKELIVCSLQEKYADCGVMELYGIAAERFGVRKEALERSARTLIASSFYSSNGFATLTKFFGFSKVSLPSVGQALRQIDEYILYYLAEHGLGTGSRG